MKIDAAFLIEAIAAHEKSKTRGNVVFAYTAVARYETSKTGAARGYGAATGHQKAVAADVHIVPWALCFFSRYVLYRRKSRSRQLQCCAED